MPIHCASDNIHCGPEAWTRKASRGNGIVREIEVLTDCEVTLLADRRSNGPWARLVARLAPGKN